MKAILFTKKHGNHLPINASLKVYAIFDSYKEAKEYLTKYLRERYDNTSTNDDFDTYEEEQLNYWAIYEEGDDNWVDQHFFAENEQ